MAELNFELFDCFFWPLHFLDFAKVGGLLGALFLSLKLVMDTNGLFLSLQFSELSKTVALKIAVFDSQSFWIHVYLLAFRVEALSLQAIK